MKRQILCKAVVNEIGGMMMSSRASVGKKQQANQAEIAELNGLVGKSREVVTKLWGKITAEKNAYNAALAEYKVNHANFSAKKTALLDRLNSRSSTPRSPRAHRRSRTRGPRSGCSAA